MRVREVGVRRWWQRERGLPGEAFDAWRRDVGEPAVLAWARSTDGFCVASAGRFAYGDAGGFTAVGWHQVERGGWNAETARLSWVLYPSAAGVTGLRRHGSADLTERGRLPEVFRERVAASVVMEQFVPIASGETRGVTIAARRDLTDSNRPLVWETTLTRGVTWQTPGLREFADYSLTRLRAEWDVP